MSGGIFRRHAVGETARTLGLLYDARRDVFLAQSLFENKPPPGAVEVRSIQAVSSTTATPRSFRERCDLIGVGPELAASIFSGLCFLPDGWEQALGDTTERPVLRHTITSHEAELSFMTEGIKDALASDVVDPDTATHVLTRITWGADLLLKPAKRDRGSDDDGQFAESAKAALMSLADSQGTADNTHIHTGFEHLDIEIQGDTIFFPASTTVTFQSARDGIQDLSANFSKALYADKYGVPISYTLMPLSLLSLFRLADVPGDFSFPQPKEAIMAEFINVFDDLANARQEILDYLVRCKHHATAIPQHHIDFVAARSQNVQRMQKAFKKQLGRALLDVRFSRATDGMDPLRILFDTFLASEHSPSALRSCLAYSDKFNFLDSILRHNTTYIGRNGTPTGKLIQSNLDKDVFVLRYSETANKALPAEEWTQTRELLDELLRENDHTKLVAVVDCDVIEDHLEKSHIVHFRHGRVYVEDLLEHRRILAVNCVMRCSERFIDSTIPGKPLDRRFVKIPCPNMTCNPSLLCDWICAVCRSPVEYGRVNNKLYCDCGASPYDAWEFKCRDTNHLSGWISYDSDDLQARLASLAPCEQLNVLILGETGVGKSTWINAFVNYLTHDSLDEALERDELKWVIPSSFSTQIKNPTDPHGRFVQQDIKIGNSKDERDGARGQSATQRTCVYTVSIGNTRVRLIDTPGIGDTRGLDQDNRNMADILHVLRTYDELHGILILLKPNAARLTVMFRFCIKQLLTHLHKNAAHNIVFGFTNTRGSNYKPGDTFRPLETLLTEYKKVKLGLFPHNVFCFDSESFRYLAARKQGVDIGALEENARSWDYSVTESKRLVDHFKGLTPHSVRSTINLNETRDMIVRLTEPMALIAQKIQTSIAVNNEKIEELQNAHLSRTELEKSLYVQRESVESYEVGQPRTACTHHDCVEVQSGFSGRDEKVIVYKTMCHNPCSLSGIKRNQKGHPQLERCIAMGHQGFCHTCGHHFMDHMHIYYDYRPVTHQFVDETINKNLLKSATDIQLQEEAIQMRQRAIDEFRIEYKQVQDAAIHFGFFLKRHAIEPYNDATVEYVDHLIHQERMKIESGGRAEILEMLEKYKAEHIQRVAVLTKAMESGNTEDILDDAGVQQLVAGLFGLPHFGEDLKRIVANNEKAVDAAFREKTFNVSAGGNWTKTRGGRREKAPAGGTSAGGSGSNRSKEEDGGQEVGLLRWRPQRRAGNQIVLGKRPDIEEGRAGFMDGLRQRVRDVVSGWF